MGATRARAPSLARLRPSEIWYTFGRVRDRFSGCGRTLEETLEAIRDGALAVDDLPSIAVVTHDVDVDEASDDDDDDDDGFATTSTRGEAERGERAAEDGAKVLQHE